MSSDTPTIPRSAVTVHGRRALLAMVWVCIAVALASPPTMGRAGAAQPATGAGAASPPPTVIPAYRQAQRVAVLTVRGGIDGITRRSLERRMEQAKREGADAVVIDIDTPGGEMGAMLDICNLFKDRNDTPANIVAWIHPTAYSAGSVIALACREIVVAPNAVFGDAAPIQLSVMGLQSLSPTERAKVLTPIMKEIGDSATRNHYDENLVQAFVRLGDGLWLLENKHTGERVFVGPNEYREVFGSDPPAMVANLPIMPAQTGQPKGVVRPAIDTSIPRAADQTGLTAEQLAAAQAFNAGLPAPRPALSSADRDDWKLVRQVVDDQTLLTVRADEALYYGLATAIVANDADLQAYFGASSITRYDESWSEGMVRFLVSWPVRAVLIVVFLIALFIEMASPGMGVFGALAATALLILIGAPSLAGMAQWWEVLLIAVGIALVLAEIFVIPGTGVAGIAGAVSLLVGLVATFVSDDLSTPQGESELWTGLLTTLTSIFAAGVGMWLISRQIHSFPVINRLILHAELPSDRSATAPSEESQGLLAAMGADAGGGLHAGLIGMAETDLKPAGRAMFGGRMVDVQSSGAYIARGSPVRITSVGRFMIEVEDANA